MNRRIGRTGLPISYTTKLWIAAAVAAGVAFALKMLVGGLHSIPVAAIVLGVYGVLYFAVTAGFGLREARNVVNRVLRLTGYRSQ